MIHNFNIILSKKDLNQGGRYLNQPWKFRPSNDKLFSHLSVITLKQGKIGKTEKTSQKYAEFNNYVKQEYLKNNISLGANKNFQVGTYGRAFADSLYIYYVMLREAMSAQISLKNGTALVDNLR